MLDALVALLEREGWCVVPASDGQEALDQLARGLRPKLAVIDLMLPKVSGWDLLQHFREQPEFSGIRTLVISGFPRQNLRVTADVVLHKPVDHDRLIAAVRSLIEPGSDRSPGKGT